MYIKKFEPTVIKYKSIKIIENKYSAKYMCDLSILDKNDNWVNIPVAIFYQKKPSKPEYSNYFGIYSEFNARYGKYNWNICDARSILSETSPLVGVVADSGEIIYSRYRHDYVSSTDRSVYIDGGRDYTKTNKPDKLIKLDIIDYTIVPGKFLHHQDQTSTHMEYSENQFRQ